MCVGSWQAGVRFALSKRRLRRGHVIKKQGGGRKRRRKEGGNRQYSKSQEFATSEALA